MFVSFINSFYLFICYNHPFWMNLPDSQRSEREGQFSFMCIVRFHFATPYLVEPCVYMVQQDMKDIRTLVDVANIMKV